MANLPQYQGISNILIHMVRTALAGADPDEPQRPVAAPRPDHLSVVTTTPEPDEYQVQVPGEPVLTAADIARLPPAARHRIAAYVHTQLADLEEMA
ncbi:hypothetical protein GCM10027088_65790 [Nocardia goodfellowii]